MSHRKVLIGIITAACIITAAFVSYKVVFAAAITVNTTVDISANDGQCSLREAILAANANTASGALAGECVAGSPGLDTIAFALGAGAPSIAVTADLPELTEPVIIEGNTGGATRIELKGTPGTTTNGLVIRAGDSTINALVINRFDENGILLRGKGNNKITNCYIGLAANGASEQGNGAAGVLIDNSPNNTIGGTTAAVRNLISGNTSSGIEITGTLATGNLVQGNYIGVDLSGTLALPNDNGVLLEGAANHNTIGGVGSGTGNLISGNSQNGVDFDGVTGAAPTNNLVQGNYIGTDHAGAVRLGNNGNGVQINNAPSNTIGGTSAAERNIISGNDAYGVWIRGDGATGNLVEGNYIGTNAAGTATLGNGQIGLLVQGAPNNTIGGTVPGAGNVISGNDQDGLWIEDTTTAASGNLVQGNFIGTNASGTAALGNTKSGITLNSTANNTIGGTAVGARNLVSSNGDNGGICLLSNAHNNTVQGNYVGTDSNGTGDLGNSANGIYLANASNNLIGGTVPGAGNLIAHNHKAGINIVSVKGNLLRGNNIANNGGLGIDLGGTPGVTPNDLGEGDPNVKNIQNFPVLGSATNNGSNTVITGTLNSKPNATYVIEFFVNTACDSSGYGEGQTALLTTTVTTDGSGNAPFNVTPASGAPQGSFITSTATDSGNSTSEFSACQQVIAPGAPTPTPIGTPATATPTPITTGTPAPGTPTATPTSTGTQTKKPVFLPFVRR